MSEPSFWSNGAGGVLLDIFTTIMLWLAALLQFAVLRDRSIPETKQADSSRWIIVAGFFGLAGRFTFLLIANDADLPVSPLGLIPVALLALGAIGLGLEQLRKPVGHRRCTDLTPHEWPKVQGGGARR